MPGIDKRLEKRFRQLEGENRRLHQELNSLSRNQGNQGGNSVRRKINSMLRLSTLGDNIANKRLYLPGSKVHPVGPRFRRRRLF